MCSIGNVAFPSPRFSQQQHGRMMCSIGNVAFPPRARAEGWGVRLLIVTLHISRNRHVQLLASDAPIPAPHACAMNAMRRRVECTRKGQPRHPGHSQPHTARDTHGVRGATRHAQVEDIVANGLKVRRRVQRLGDEAAVLAPVSDGLKRVYDVVEALHEGPQQCCKRTAAPQSAAAAAGAAGTHTSPPRPRTNRGLELIHGLVGLNRRGRDRDVPVRHRKQPLDCPPPASAWAHTCPSPTRSARARRC
jgi:hypothetical protein